MKRQKWNYRKSIVLISVFILILITVAAFYFVGKPMIRFVSEPEKFRAWVNDKGIFGRLAFLGMTMLQVIIAIIPGEPMELVAGYAFGSIEGTILCIVGATLGGIPVFLLVRKFGVKAVEVFFPKEKIESLKFLKSSEKRDLWIFILFLIPGTPKDMLNYFVGLTDMKITKWLIISLVARIPSIVTSTIGGDALGVKNYTFAVIVFLVTILISGIGLLGYKRICKIHEKRISNKYSGLLQSFVDVCKTVFNKQLTGVYLHGSLAMGCFNDKKSDINLIIVVKEQVSDEQKYEILNRITEFNKETPYKGIEAYIVLKKYCSPFMYPTPFELSFSPKDINLFLENPENYISEMRGESKKLATYFTIINRYGISLYGEKIDNIFSKVPKKNYIDSIYEYVKSAQNTILVDPVQTTLNLCRSLAYAKKNLLLSKLKGGEWGLRNMDKKYHSLIADAIECYKTEKKMQPDILLAKQYASDIAKALVDIK